TGAEAGSTTTAADGTYVLGGLPAGTYALEFEHDEYATAFSGGAVDLEDATAVTVTTGKAAVANATLHAYANLHITLPGTEWDDYVYLIRNGVAIRESDIWGEGEVD